MLRSRCLRISLTAIALMAAVIFVAALPAMRASAADEKTYTEFIVDASFSMTAKVEGKKSRMDVAKEVLTDLVEGLRDDPNLEIALRVYGFELPGKSPCEDSGLLQPFGPVGKVRAPILKIVQSLRPRGQTPIGYSLREAVKDFPDWRSGRNVIVLITDGEESCGADPCAISRELQQQGIIMKPYVVGFGLDLKAEEKVKCIGHYFSAKDRDTLNQALKSIMVQVVAAPSLEVEVWADGANVTARTDIQILDSAGRPVPVEVKQPAGQVLKLSVDEGVYTVRGRFVVDNDTIETSQTGVSLKAGETTRIRLDFGQLTGSILLYADAGGRRIPPSALKAVVYSGGTSRGQLKVDGDALSIRLSPATYHLECTYGTDPEQSRIVEGIEVKRGEVRRVNVQFQQPGRLQVKAFVNDSPSDQVDVKLFQGGSLIKPFTKVSGVRGLFEANVLEGTYDVVAIPAVAGFAEKNVSNIQVREGQTVETEVRFAVTKIRVNLLSDGKPHREGRVMLYWHDPDKRSIDSEEYVCDLESVSRGVYEQKVKEGIYDIYLVNLGEGYANRELRKVEVVAGQTLEKNIELGGSGVLRVNLQSDGKPHREGRVMLYTHDPDARRVGDQEYVCDLESVSRGVYEQKVKEGIYDIHLVNLGEGYANRELRKVEVVAGQTLEKNIELGGSGVLRAKLIVNGKPHDEGWIMVYAHDPDEIDPESQEYVSDLDEVSRGVYEQKLREGTYDLCICDLGEAFGFDERWIRGVDVAGGSTTERILDFGRKATVRLNLTIDGKAAPSDDFRVMVYSAETQDYVRDLEPTRRGVFEGDLIEGTYEIEISDGWNSYWLRDVEVTGGSLELRVDLDSGDFD